MTKLWIPKLPHHLLLLTISLLPYPGYAALVNPSLPKKYTSKHFHVYTKLSKKYAKSIALNLEIFRKKFLYLFRFKKLNIRPVCVYVFQTQNQFNAFCKLHKKNMLGRMAFCDWEWGPGDAKKKEKFRWRLITWAHPPKDLIQYLIHELTHIFLNFYLDNPPLWLDEGLAVYFQTAQIHRKKIYVGFYPKKFLQEYKSAIRQKKTIPFQTLLAYSADDDDKFTSLHYAQSWAIIHYFLRGNPKWRRPFGKFLKACAKKPNYHKNYQKYIRIPPPQLEKIISQYVFQLRY